MTEDDFEWRRYAACHDMTDIFFPGRGDPTNWPKSICETCPVMDECLDYALRTCQVYGVWGGKSERQRRVLRTRCRKSASLMQESIMPAVDEVALGLISESAL